MIDSFQNALVQAGNMGQNGAFSGMFGGGGGKQLQQTDMQVGNYVQPNQLSGGSYINPFMMNPQQNYTNPFIR
jgi:hypothetical protein